MKNLHKIVNNVLTELESFPRKIENVSLDPNDTLAHPENGFTDSFSSSRQISAISAKSEFARKSQDKEPFTCYVEVLEDGTPKIYLVYRKGEAVKPKIENATYCSYYSDMGKIAEWDVNGSKEREVEIRKTKTKKLKILKKLTLIPKREKEIWDGKKANYHFQEEDVQSIGSLRNYLEEIKRLDDKTDWNYDQFLKELEARQVIASGLKIAIRREFTLRDQPILDERQGDVFRQSLNSRIVVTGAPGTGKTTVLIKRVSRFIEPREDTEIEIKKLIYKKDKLDSYLHEKNWLLITPTSLLQTYLKDAFTQEGIPASDSQIDTWETFRKKLIRDHLAIIKVGNDKKSLSVFTIGKEENEGLKRLGNVEMLKFAERFRTFVLNTIASQYEHTRQFILNAQDSRLQSHFKSPLNPIDNEIIDRFRSISTIGNILKKMRQERDEGITLLINQVGKEQFKQISAEISEFESLQQNNKPVVILTPITNQIEDENEDVEDEDVEDEESQIGTTDNEAKINLLIRSAIQRKAESLIVDNVKIKPKIRIILNVVESILKANNNRLKQLGEICISIKKTSLLQKGIEGYFIDRIPRLFNKFRREYILDNDTAYDIEQAKKAIRDSKIGYIEAEVISYVMLKNAYNYVVRQRRNEVDYDTTKVMEKLKRDVYKTHILVDESTDFSLLQLTIMRYLAFPFVDSIFYCGDIMQRFETKGIESWDILRSSMADIRIFEINKVYRQTPKLLNIASKLYQSFIGNVPHFESAFEDSHAHALPLKYKTNGNLENTTDWISERIMEIHSRLDGQLPTIGIVVNDDSDDMFNMLEAKLDGCAIPVENCKGGGYTGNSNAVRVFNVKHIKGLEFASVFFVNINELAITYPTLVEKYLYVGLTRAVMYSAVIYEGAFPKELAVIENDFHEGTWALSK